VVAAAKGDDRPSVHPGFLEVLKDGKDKRISGFLRSANWPPPPDFFAGDAIGLAYFLPSFFRYNLQAWIHDRMHELESKAGVYSLEGGQRTNRERRSSPIVDHFAVDVSHAQLRVQQSDGIAMVTARAAVG
jgi:hypothetical protein